MNLNSGQASLVNTACSAANLLLYGFSACSDGIGGTNGQRPLSSAWSSDTRDRNDVFGLGLQKDFRRFRLSVDYSYSKSATDINYAYGSTALSNVAANQAALALIAGSALPSMTYVQHNLDINAVIPVNKKLAVRLFDHYEIGRVKDWHYDNVITGAVLNIDSNTLLLDAGPQSYHANIVGAFIQYKL